MSKTQPRGTAPLTFYALRLLLALTVLALLAAQIPDIVAAARGNWERARLVQQAFAQPDGPDPTLIFAEAPLSPADIEAAAHSSTRFRPALLALSRSGRFDEAIALYERNPALLRDDPAARDAVALAYLDRWQRNPSDSTLLERALSLRPADLVAHFHLWEQARAVGDTEQAQSHEAALRTFPLAAVDPSDERLVAKAAAIVPALLDAGLWDAQTARNVFAFWVWQHANSEGLAQAIEPLQARDSSDPAWPAALAELSRRRAESTIIADAARPDANLVPNGNLDSWQAGRLQNWNYRAYLGPDGDGGLYVVGDDRLPSGETFLRMLALRGGQLADNTISYAEFVNDGFNVGPGRYGITVEYAADFDDDVSTGLLLLSNERATHYYELFQTPLPDTDGAWRTLNFEAAGPASSEAVLPLARLWGKGQLWLRTISVVRLPAENAP